nr:putative ribonuclease H-like domain-containing protein [Tanacetum cinerariifolium]
IDNDIYSTVDACPNACEMWKAIKRLKQEPSMVAEDDETSKDKEIDKLMDLISLSFKKIYKPTNNNIRTSSNTSREKQDNSLRINRSAGYENQRIGNVAGARENVGSSVDNDVNRLQALVDKKKVVVTKAAIRESMSAKRTLWNEFSSAMAFAVIAYRQRVGKGFSRVETPLFEGVLVGQVIEEGGDAEEHVKDVTAGDTAQGDDNAAHREVLIVSQEPSIPSPTPPTPPSQPPQDLPSTSQRVDTSDDTVMDDASNQGRIIDELDNDDDVVLMDDKEEDKKEEEVKVIENDQVQGRQAESQAEIYKIDMDHASKVLSMQEDEPAEVQEVVDDVTTTKLITEVATTASEIAIAARVVIRDLEEESTTSSIIPTDTKSKDKGKGIMVEEPKPLKKKQQVKMDEEYARKLHVELNKDIDWDTKEQMEEEESRALQSINETPAQKVAKRRKLNEEVEDLKGHLEIVPDEDDDVYTEATPLTRKVPVVDYEIINLKNKPYYKIIRADGTYQLFISFLTLLKNFDREDLEALWTGPSLKEYTWSIKGQELEATGIMCTAKQKLMLLDSAAEGRLMLLSQVNAASVISMYLKGKPHLGLWYPKDSPFNLVAYSDSDYAGASLDRTSTIGGCQFLGCKLISWQCKRQTVVATSPTEAEYVAAAR